MINITSKCDEAKQSKKFLSVQRNVKKQDRKANDKSKTRKKRFVMANPSKLWTGGKVPYIDGESQGNQRAMKTFERFTCIRFYPWSKHGNTTTNDELGLDHQSYLKFIYGGG